MHICQINDNFKGWINSLSLKPEKATEPPSPLVPFLQKFAEPRNKKPSVSIFKIAYVTFDKQFYHVFI